MLSFTYIFILSLAPCLEAYKKIETKRIGRRIIEVEKTIKDKV